MSAPVSISTVSRASNVVTVTTAAAHGLSAGQSATHAGITDTTFNGVYTVASVVDATHYTFAQAGANGSSSAGTVTATKQIIGLWYDPTQAIGKAFMSVAMWFPVVAGNEIPASGSSSGFKRATADENAAIAAGRIVEVLDSYPVPSTYSGTEIEVYLERMYAAILTARNAQAPIGQYYGFNTNDNGVSWPRA